MNIAIIPARGGSKRLKNKNIFPLLGKPLIAYSIEACIQSGVIDEVYVSSDSEKILTVGEQFGAKSLQRPEELADDKTPKVVAIRQAYNQLLELGVEAENVAIVQANSPQLSADFMNLAFKKFNDFKLWELMSADENGIQNAALRIVKSHALFNEFLSAHCGFITQNMVDVHTIEDIHQLEKLMS
jgi:CMP-N-acetylneuraminic acid synthetase